jgi:predicted PurR-regulated permease PerM
MAESPRSASSLPREHLEESEEPEGWAQRWPPLAYWMRVTLVVVLTLAVLAGARSVANILILVVVALVLAVGFDPLVQRLTARGLSRPAAVSILVLSLVAIGVAFGALIVPPLVSQASHLADDIPTYAARLAQRDDAIGEVVRRNDVVPKVQDFIQHLPQRAAGSFGTVLGVAGKVGGMVFSVLTISILTIYFLLALPSMRRTATIVFPLDRRRQGARVMDRSIDRIGGYVYGNLITSVLCGATTLVALLLLGVPFAVPLALWAGFADLIPLVGAYMGAAPAIIVAFFVSPLSGIITLVYFVVYQQFENYVLVPRVMRNAVNLSAPAVILSTLIGGSLAGFAGALLALPVAAAGKVLVTDLWLRDRVKEGDELAKERYLEERRSEFEASSAGRKRAAFLKHVTERIWRGRDEGPNP